MSGFIAILFLLLPLYPVIAQENMHTRPLFDFTLSDAAVQWRSVNDDVMGGVSSSRLEAAEDGYVQFYGVVSLENNGGFASVRCLPRSFDFDDCDGIRLRIRGDGKDYRLRLRTDDGFDGVAYQSIFATEADRWISVDIFFSSFRASFRGREVPNAPALDPARIRQIGFMIADGQEGSFRLDISSISAMCMK
jgi:monofunctional biosynthetic peptidoglycan transglycosylase